MASVYSCAAMCWAFIAALPISAQTAADEMPVAPVAAPQVSPVVATPSCAGCVPKLTVVELVIDAELGSKISTTGATFPLHLEKPLVVDGKEVVPAGTIGQGEIVHAKKAGGSGAAGELVLAARFLTVGERKLRLRSMRIALTGGDAIGKVDAYNAAAAGAGVLTPIPFGLLGFAVTGKNVVVPKGAQALAKTAEDFPVEAAAPAPTDSQVPAPAAVVAQTKEH
ncbi:MAG: hypothetical protein HOO94_06355 [Novosphingobium sp.]|nr:hypothetical protein [Novosphingobium sp.]